MALSAVNKNNKCKQAKLAVGGGGGGGVGGTPNYKATVAGSVGHVCTVDIYIYSLVLGVRSCAVCAVKHLSVLSNIFLHSAKCTAANGCSGRRN